MNFDYFNFKFCIYKQTCVLKAYNPKQLWRKWRGGESAPIGGPSRVTFYKWAFVVYYLPKLQIVKAHNSKSPLFSFQCCFFPGPRSPGDLSDEAGKQAQEPDNSITKFN